MSTFPGFGISGYRTLSGDVQWIPLDPSITVFLGANNAGKSNVLRLLNVHMQSLFHSLTEGQPLQSFDPRFDAPIGGAESEVTVFWPLDVEGITAHPQYEGIRDDLATILALPQFNENVPRASLPFTSPSLTEPLAITLPYALDLLQSSQGTIEWQRLSSFLTSGSGGAAGEDTHRVLVRLRQWCIRPPETELVPPGRALRAGAETAEWNFSGEGISTSSSAWRRRSSMRLICAQGGRRLRAI